MSFASEFRTKLDSARQRKFIKPSEVLFIAAFIVIVAVLLKILIGNLLVRHEVSQATTLANSAATDIASQDTTALRALGTQKFKTDHTAAELNSDLTFKTDPPLTFAQIYGKNGKRSIDHQIVANNSHGQNVVIIYRYDKLKVPIFVRLDTIKPPSSGRWYLQALSVSPDESQLLGS